MVQRLFAGVLRVFWWTALAVALAVSVVYTGVYLRLNDVALGSLISSQVSRTERGTFSLRRVHYSYLGGLCSLLFQVSTRVTGEDFELRDPDGNLVMAVPRVEADVHMQDTALSLLKLAISGRFYLDIHAVRAHIPRGFAVIAPTHSSAATGSPELNIVAAMTPRRPTPADGEFRITVDDVVVDSVDFALGVPRPGGGPSWYGRIEGGSYHASLVYSSSLKLENPAGPYFFFRVSPLKAQTGMLVLGDFRFPLSALEVARFGPEPGRRQDLVFSGRARTLGAEVTVSGAIVDAYTVPGIRLRIDFTHGRELARLLPPPLAGWLGGQPSGKVTIEGRFADPVVAGEVRGVDANLGGLKVTALQTRFRLGSDSVLRLAGAHGRVADGRVKGSAEVDLGKRGWWRAQLALERVRPEQVSKLPRALGSVLAGRIDGTLRLGGSLYDHPEVVHLGPFDAWLERRTPGWTPRRVHLSGDAELAPDRVTLKRVHAAAEGLDLEASGQVQLSRGEVAGSFNLYAERPDALLDQRGVSKVRVGAAHASGRVRGTVLKPALAGTIELEDVSGWGRKLERVRAEAVLRGGALIFSHIEGAGLEGRVAGEVELGLLARADASELRQHPTLKAHLRGAGVSAALLSGYPGAAGHLDLELDLEGLLAHPVGKAALFMRELAIDGDAYDDAHVVLTFNDRVRLHELLLRRRRGGVLTGSGEVSWDGALDLRLAPRDFPLAALPFIRSLPVVVSGAISGEVRVQGSFERPEPAGRITLTGFKIRDTLLGDGKLELKPVAAAIAVSGSFFQNVTVDGSLTLAPKLAGAFNIAFRDVALEKIVPAMNKLGEVRGRVSGDGRIAFAGAELTAAALNLREVSLTLSDTDDEGQPRRLVFRNEGEVLLSYDRGGLHFQRAHFSTVSTASTASASLGDFTLDGRVSQKDNDVAVHGEIGLELLEYFFHSYFEHTHGDAFADLTIRGDSARPEINGSLDLRKALVIPRGFEQQQKISIPSGRLEFTASKVILRNLSIRLEDATAQASGEVALDHMQPGAISADVTGDLSARFLQLRWPDHFADASGRLHVERLHLGGTWQQPTWQGRAEFKEVRVHARKLNRELLVPGGTVSFRGNDILLGCPRGGDKLVGCVTIKGNFDDNGSMAVNGVISIGEKWSVKRVDVLLEGSEITHSTPEYAVTISPRVSLRGSNERLELSGDIDLIEGRYTQDYDFLQSAVFRPRVVETDEPFWAGNPLLENMSLKLRTHSVGPLYVKDNLADLTLTSRLELSGTLGDPRLAGQVRIDEGGTYRIPGARTNFTSTSGQVEFDRDRPVHDATLDIQALGVLIDTNDISHNILFRASGTLGDIRPDFSSQDGWDRTQSIVALFSGRTPEELRRLVQNDPTIAASPGGSGPEVFAKSMSGMILNQLTGDALRKLAGFDSASIEFGTGSLDFNLSKRFGRYIRTVGRGEWGFAGSTHLEGGGELRLSDYLKGLMRLEYLTRGVETQEESRTRLRFELNYRVPIR